MTLRIDQIIDISLDLDARNYRMHTPKGFARDMQFAVETCLSEIQGWNNDCISHASLLCHDVSTHR